MIWQWLQVDPRGRAAYLGGVLLLAGCGGGIRLQPILPLGMEPASVEDAREWTGGTRPNSARLVRFRFQYRDELGAAGGRGSIRVTPGDSLRFDVIGALGVGRGAAFVLGDSAVWAQPEDEIAKLVPNYPLLWAMVGVARAPQPTAQIRRALGTGVLAWQFAEGADTVEYVRSGAPAGKLIADVRQGGQRVGRVETVFGPDGVPISARLIVPSAPAQLNLTFLSTTTQAHFDPDTWTPPPPP